MPITFIHTADWQLGRSYAGVADEQIRTRMQDQRFETLDAIVLEVKRDDVAFVVVAGDLFDTTTPDNRTVATALRKIGAMTKPVYVIPGNHDHGSPGLVWDSDFFARQCQAHCPNLFVIRDQKPVVREDCVLLPAPLLQRQTYQDPTQWIRTAHSEGGVPASLPRIVVAHGSVQGFDTAAGAADDEGAIHNNTLDLTKLPVSEIDYVALGDWHGMKRVDLIPGEKCWYSGTHEIDRFPKGELNKPGHVLRVTVSRGATPVVQPIRTTTLRWIACERSFAEDSAVEGLKASLAAETEGLDATLILKLSLRGNLGYAAQSALRDTLEDIEANVMRLQLDHKVRAIPTEAELEALTARAGDPLIAKVARRLRDEVAAASATDVSRDGGTVGRTEGEHAAIAGIALQRLYEMVVTPNP